MLNLMTQRTTILNLTVENGFSGPVNPSPDLNDLLMKPQSYAATAVVLFLIGFFGFFLNLIVIVLMLKDKELRTPMNIILFNLVCSDFSVSILGNPFTLISALSHHWIFGRTLCVIYGFFMSILGINSITTLTVLSFERYTMISRPFRQHHLTTRGAKLVVAFIWTYSFALTGPPLFGWGDYVNEAANISCSVNWEHSNSSTTSYIIFLFLLGLLVPVGIITFSYVNIVVTLKQVGKKTFRSSQVSKAEAKVAIMVGVMILAFLTAWTPYAVMALLIAFGDPGLISPGVAVIPALMAKSSICYNPIIYAGLNPQFQASWRKHVLGQHRRSRECDLTTFTPPPAGNSFRLIPFTKKTTKVSSDGQTSVLSKSKNAAKVIEREDSSDVLQVTFHLEGDAHVSFQ